MFIDADTHVDECADTWSYFPASLQEMRPVAVVFENDEQPGYIRGRHHRGLFIDGQMFPRQLRSDSVTGTTEDARELRDIPSRLRQMDELEVETQIIYPTLLLMEVTTRPELEIAICESYNRWVADRCKESGGRLKWAAVLPLRSMPHALKELRRAKDDGATAVFKRGYECDNRHASDPYFRPLYELAQELDMAVCVHTSHPYGATANLLTNLQKGLPSSFYVQDAFLSIVKDGIPTVFPRLRFGFIEAAAGWVPHVLWLAGFDPVISNKRKDGNATQTRALLEDVLATNRFYVTCEISENIANLVDLMGDGSLIVGSDFGHNDRAAVYGIQKQIIEREDISKQTAENLILNNAKKLYGIA